MTMVLFVLSLACLLGHSVLITNAAVEDKCGDGYDFFHGDNTCIKAYGDDNRKTWLKAREQCQEEGGDLVSIESDMKNTFVTEKLNTENYYWIGIKNTAATGFSFFNVNGQPMSYKNWKQDQPDNWKNNEHCVMIFGNRQPPIRRGKWNDNDCMKALQFVCQRDVLKPTDTCTKYEPDGTCIKVMFEPETWRQAKENCEADRGSLVIIDSAEKNDFVTEMLFSSRPFWTGARVSAKEKPQIVIKYVDGQLASYNNGGSQEFCVMMYGKRQPIDFRGVWDDFDCSHKLPYVCQYPPVAKEEAKSEPDGLKCIEGWSLFSPDGTCVKKTDVLTSYDNAKASCQEQKNGNLVAINSEAKNKFVTELLSGSFYWIGVESKDGGSDLRDMNGNSLGEYQPTWWAGSTGRFDDSKCVILGAYAVPEYYGIWLHGDCTSKLYFVCEMPHSN